MSMDTSGECRFTLMGEWTEEAVSLLNRAVGGWWSDCMEYTDEVFEGLSFSAKKPYSDRLHWRGDTSIGFQRLVGFAAGGKACVPEAGYADLTERENFDPEVHQVLLRVMKEQDLRILISHMIGYLEGTSEFEDDEEDPDGWDEDRIFDESCVRHVLSSGGGKFILEDFRWETSIAT